MKTLITENLDVWSSAIKAKSSAGRGSGKKQVLYGIKKLRELILELAVRGLLVEQDPEDESASELLEKIATQKSRLIKDGEIKKQPKLSPVENDEFPFSLPLGWRFERVGNLTSKLGSGSTPRGGKSAYVSDGIIFLRSQNVWNDGLKLDDTAFIPEETHEIMQNTQVFPRDVLLNITGASLGRSTIFPKELKTANVSQHVTIIRLIESEMAEFLHLGILSPLVQKLVWGRQVGMAIEGLSKKVLEKFEFPIPPLAEQHRIVAKVDELMALCDQLEQQQEDSLRTHDTLVATLLAALTAASERGQFAQAWQRIEANFDTLFTTQSSIEQLKQTILQLAVMGKLVEQDPEDEPASELLKKIAAERANLIKAGKMKKRKPERNISLEERPFELPSHWEWCRFGVLFISFNNGLYKKSNFYTDDGMISLRMYNISDGEINFSGVRRVEVEPAELEQFSLEAGDLLINRVNSKELVGKTAVIQPFNEPLVFESMNMRAKPHSNHTDAEYLNIYMRSRLARETIFGFAKEAVGQASINQGQVGSLLTPLPPQSEQHRIVAKVDELMALCDRLKANLKTAQTTQLNLADSLVESAIG